VIGLKAALLYTDALYVIDQALEQVTGLKPDLLSQMDDASLLAFINGEGGPDPDRLMVTADLFYEAADIHTSVGNQIEAKNLHQRALLLYLEAALVPDLPTRQAMDAGEKIDSILNRIPLDELPTGILYSLFCLYEIKKSFKLAERALLTMQKLSPPSAELEAEVQAFNRRMSGLSDLELSLGGLSRSDFPRSDGSG
jgi:hypothetical protein